VKKKLSALNISLTVLMISALICGCASFSVPEEPKFKKIPMVYAGTQDMKINPDSFWPDSELKKTFERYWSLLYVRDLTKVSFAMETPYFQEMVDEERYNVYIGSAWQNEPIEISFQKITKDADNLYSFVFTLKLKLVKGEIHEVSMSDQWVKVRGKWYHVLRDMLVFPAAS